MPNENFEVGYGKPPKATQFKKGKSGNPKGRPKNSTSLHTMILRAGSESVTIRENGKQRRLTHNQLVIEQKRNRASAGEQRAGSEWLKLIFDAEQTAAAIDEARGPRKEKRRRELMDGFKKRNADFFKDVLAEENPDQEEKKVREERPINVIP